MTGILLATLLGIQDASAHDRNHQQHRHQNAAQIHHRNQSQHIHQNKLVWVSGHWKVRAGRTVWIRGHWEIRRTPGVHRNCNHR